MTDTKPHGNTGKRHAAKANPKVKTIYIRVTPEQKRAYEQASRPGKLSPWIIRALDRAVLDNEK